MRTCNLRVVPPFEVSQSVEAAGSVAIVAQQTSPGHDPKYLTSRSLQSEARSIQLSKQLHTLRAAFMSESNDHTSERG
jgi:hypothetical protein